MQEKTHLSTHRLDYLDSIRGFAAMFVLLGHTLGIFAWPGNYKAATEWPFFSILFNGKEAVAMFFVLSGYVLSKPYISQMPGCNRTVFVPTFYLRRFTRIWLPWFFAFLVSLVVKTYFFTVPDTTPRTTTWFHWFWTDSPMTVSDFLRQCFFIQHRVGLQLLNQDWSLGVELKASILMPLFIWAARPGRLVLDFVAILILLFFFGDGHFYISFIFGVLVARFDHVFYRNSSLFTTWMKCGLFITGLILYQMYQMIGRWEMPGWVEGSNPGWILSSAGCGCIIWSVLASPGLQRLLNSRMPVFLGRISYSVYLLQFVILLAVMPHFLKLLNRLAVPMPLEFILVMLSSSILTIASGTLMYFLIESKVITLGHWLTRKLDKNFPKVFQEKVVGSTVIAPSKPIPQNQIKPAP